MNTLKHKPIDQWTDDEVMDEARRMLYLYRLKSTLRYDGVREEVITTETVAEHVYGLYNLALYFLPLEDPERKQDWYKVLSTIVWHDADEIETGDIVTYKKTDADREREFSILETVYTSAPRLLETKIRELLTEYMKGESWEARFIKAIDKLECSFEITRPGGKERLINDMDYSFENFNQVESKKDFYTKDFPYMNRFAKVLAQYMIDNEYYKKP